MRKVRIILVCGGRYYNDGVFMYAVLDGIRALYGGDVLILHGAMTGADTLAETWAKAREQLYFGVPAEWMKYGRSAGPKRNDEMSEIYPDAGVAFPGGAGTADMVYKLHKLGIRVHDVR